MYLGFEVRATLAGIKRARDGRYFQLNSDLEGAKASLSRYYSELREKHPRAKLSLVVFSTLMPPAGKAVPLLSDYYPNQYTKLEAMHRALEYFYIGTF